MITSEAGGPARRERGREGGREGMKEGRRAGFPLEHPKLTPGPVGIDRYFIPRPRSAFLCVLLFRCDGPLSPPSSRTIPPPLPQRQ